MKYEDIKQYIRGEQERTVYYEISQEHEIVKELFEIFGTNRNEVEYKEVEEYLKKKAPHWKWVLGSIGSKGDTITSYYVKDRYKPANICVVDYKGVTFKIDFLLDGTCHNVSHTWNIYQRDQFMRSSHHSLPICDTIEETFQKVLEEIAKSKRKWMTYYNAQIRRIKQAYKETLKEHNDMLKHKG